MQLQVEEAEETRRREGDTLEEIRQLRHENQELQRRMYETEELARLQKEQVAVMHDSMQDLRQQKKLTARSANRNGDCWQRSVRKRINTSGLN